MTFRSHVSFSLLKFFSTPSGQLSFVSSQLITEGHEPLQIQEMNTLRIGSMK
jgi:hypothetical protein